MAFIEFEPPSSFSSGEKFLLPPRAKRSVTLHFATHTIKKSFERIAVQLHGYCYSSMVLVVFDVAVAFSLYNMANIAATSPSQTSQLEFGTPLLDFSRYTAQSALNELA